jgi:hypothetical protein
MAADKDFSDIADRFLRFVHRETKLPIIICDSSGTIVKAVVKNRVGTQHAGAQRILRGEVSEYFVTAEEAAANPLVKEGCNIPIEVDGVRVGTFGIAAKLEVAQPVARLAAQVIASWIKEGRQRRALDSGARTAWTAVNEVTGRMEALRERTRSIGAAMAGAARAAAEQVGKTDDVIKTVQEISQQSRMLAINGSVEAVRAGEHGRAFAVLSREMLELAEHARSSAGEIQATLGEVRGSIERLTGAMSESNAVATEQAEALARTAQAVEALQKMVASLAASFEEGRKVPALEAGAAAGSSRS